jgi:hypothetical protein
MKFGIRKPSRKKRMAARTSLKRYVRHKLGLKAPSGMGWVTNPKKDAYNRLYNRTTFGIEGLAPGTRRRKTPRPGSVGTLLLGILIFYLIAKLLF